MSLRMLTLLAALAGCGGDDDDDDASPDAGAALDAAVDAEPLPDAAVDAAVGASCNDRLTIGRTFAVDPDGPDTQVYSSVLADEGGLWIAYCRPELSGTHLFDVAVARMDCDGTAAAEPIVVSGPGNDGGVVMARSGDRFLVAWLRDNGVFPDNMDIVLRVLDQGGQPVGEAEQVLETTRDGAPIAGNQMDPAVAAAPDGGFWLAGERATDELSRFQVFVQRLDPDGVPVGDAIDALLEPEVSQQAPSLAVGSDGRVWLAYEREIDETTEVVFGEIAEGAAPPAPMFVDLEASGTAALAVDPDDPARVLLAATGATRIRQDVLVVEATLPEAERVVVELGEARDVEHTPAITIAPGGTPVVAYHRILQGIRNAVVVQSLDGEPQLVADDPPAGPYPYGLAALTDGLVVVTFSDGTSPDFWLRGEFVRP